MDSPHSRTRYPSDLTETQWRRIMLLLPAEKTRGRRRCTCVREVVNAINYRWRTGCVWRMLPHDFPPWATVYTYFRHWQCDGVLRQIRAVLLRRATAAQGRNGQTDDANGCATETDPTCKKSAANSTGGYVCAGVSSSLTTGSD